MSKIIEYYYVYSIKNETVFYLSPKDNEIRLNSEDSIPITYFEKTDYGFRKIEIVFALKVSIITTI